MKKMIVVVLISLVLATMICGSAVANGDENYNGEDGDQPAPGIDESPGPGEPSEAPDTGSRTRFKDA